MKKIMKRNIYRYIRVTDSLCRTPEINTTVKTDDPSVKNKKSITQVLPYSTENLYSISCNKPWEKVYAYIKVNHSAVHRELTQHRKLTTSINFFLKKRKATDGERSRLQAGRCCVGQEGVVGAAALDWGVGGRPERV